MGKIKIKQFELEVKLLQVETDGVLDPREIERFAGYFQVKISGIMTMEQIMEIQKIICQKKCEK